MNTIKSSPQRQFQFLDSFNEDDVAKAISFRNAKFDEGVNAVQSSVNAISQLPTITEEDRQLLHSRINTVVNKANSISGIDMSDQMTVKGLESEILSVYNDEDVVNAVTSAKNHINQSSLINKYKTEPKLNANYGIANEDDYNNQLMKYKKDRSEGKASVFSYQYKNFFDVDTNLQKDLKKLQADAYTELKGMYFNKIEEITPERIEAIVNNKLSADPRYSEQIKINAAFKYKNVSNDQLIQEKNREQQEQYQYLLGNKQQQLRNLMANVSDKSEDNKKLIENVNIQNTQLEGYIKQLQLHPDSLIYMGEDGNNVIKRPETFNRQALEYNLTAKHLLKEIQGIYVSKKQSTTYNPAILAEANFKANRSDADWDKQRWNKEFAWKQQVEVWHNTNEIAKIQQKANEGNASNLGLNPIVETSIVDDPETFFNTEIDDVKKRTVNSLTSMMLENLNGVASINPNLAQEFLAGAFGENGIPGEIQVSEKNILALQKVFQEGGDGIHKQAISKAMTQEALKSLNIMTKDARNAWLSDGKEISSQNINRMNSYLMDVQNVRQLKNVQTQAENEALRNANVTREQWKLFKNENEKQHDSEYYDSRIPGSFTGGTQPRITYNRPASELSRNKYNEVKGKLKEFLQKQTEQIQRGYVQYFDPENKNYDLLNKVVIANIQDRQSDNGGVDGNGLSVTNGTFGKEIKYKDAVINASNIETSFYDSRKNMVYVKVKTGSGDDVREQTLRFPMSSDRFPQGMLSNELFRANQPMQFSKMLSLGGNMFDSKGNQQSFYLENINHPIKITYRKTFPNDVTNNEVIATVSPDIKGFVGTRIKFPSAEKANELLQGVFQQKVNELNSAVKKGEITTEEKNKRIINIIETLNQ